MCGVRFRAGTNTTFREARRRRECSPFVLYLERAKRRVRAILWLRKGMSAVRWVNRNRDGEWVSKFAWFPTYYWGKDGNEHVIWLERYERRKKPYPPTYRIDGQKFKCVMDVND